MDPGAVDPGAMDLERATDELYGISPDDFVERRKALVTAARQAKNRELVKQITALRRPTRNAWLVNVLARVAGDDLAALLDLGAELAEAQQRGSGPDLRRLSAQRRTSVDALAARAIRLGRDRGYQAPDGAIQEVAQTLQAALGDPEVAELVRRGRLTQSTTYGGFGPTDLMAALAASMPGTAVPAASAETEGEAEGEGEGEGEGEADTQIETETETGSKAEGEGEADTRIETETETGSKAEGAEGDALDEEAEGGQAPQRRPTEPSGERQRTEVAEQAAEHARAAADQAQAELQQAEAELEQAEAESEAATVRADELADEVDTLRERLRETETAEREARELARASRKRLSELRQAAAAARTAAATAAAAGEPTQ